MESVPETRTLLFSDIEGSTPAWERAPEAMRADVALHDALIVRTVTECDGVVVKNLGDGYLAAFRTAPAALDAAIAIQHRLSAELPNRRVRIALHTGDVEADGDDLRGTALSRAARVQGLIHGGQIVVTEATALLLQPALLHRNGVHLLSLGAFSLRGLTQPERLFQVCAPGLREHFPPMRGPQPQIESLPRTLTSFVGRYDECARAEAQLRSDRLLTLVGPGGVGKTRLALALATRAHDAFPGGTWFVDLSPLSDGARIGGAIADTLRLAPDPGRDRPERLAAVFDGAPHLLVIDNCEHLIDAAALLIETLLTTSPTLTILATSREALRVAGERLFAIEGLSVPPNARLAVERLRAYDAIQLFCERAATASPFALNRENAGAVVSICRRLDGLPLAIELAAAWLRTLQPAEIEARLSDRFGLLDGGSRAAPARLQTLRGALDWSWDLLPEPERRLWAHLSVFVGGATLDDIAAVCGEPDPERTLRSMRRLIDRSLVVARTDTDGEATRYGQLETVRAYGREHLHARSDAREVVERHAERFLALAESAEPHLRGPDQKQWLARLDRERDNLRAAVAQTRCGTTALRLTGALTWFWYVRSERAEGVETLERLLTAFPETDPLLRARALRAIGILETDRASAERALRAALAIYEGTGDRAEAAVVQANLGIAASDQERFEEARSALEAALSYFQEHPHPQRLGAILLNLGVVCERQHHFDAARGHFQESLRVFETLGDLQSVALLQKNLGILAVYQNRDCDAIALLLKSIETRVELGDSSQPPDGLVFLATAVWRASHDAALSTRLLGKAQHQAQTGIRLMDPTDQAVMETLVSELIAALGQDTFDHLRRQTLDEILSTLIADVACVARKDR
jgi:predicted ATPase/class 3 adenylate cyclase